LLPIGVYPDFSGADWRVAGGPERVERPRPLGRPSAGAAFGGGLRLTRQAVHATVTRLVRDGLLGLAPNADHRRSQLIRVTEPGRATYSAIDKRQAEWVNRLARGIDRSDLETTARALDELCRRLEANGAKDTASSEGEEE
jgi:DNA-binding MarR family transcriptional regulator